MDRQADLLPVPYFHVVFKTPPTWIGGCGLLTGLGLAIIGSKWTNSPWYSASGFVQISFIASMDSRIRLKRLA
jgi:hypothetical protein